MPSKWLLFPGRATALLLGNEAIARGALEAGIGFASAYPGTPSTEIVESLAWAAQKFGIHVEWSSNEKVALEAAWAASVSGVRALAAMKHVGLNVAADAFMSIGYTGVRAGLVIVSAGDPGMWSSQNEQDNRYYGLLGYIPVFEPSDPGEAKELTVKAFEFSEEHEHAVLMITTTRVSHVRGPVELKDLPKNFKTKGWFDKDPSRFTLVPQNARARREHLVSKWEAIRDALSNLQPFNRIEGDGRILIVADGVSYLYASEAAERLGIDARMLKLATPVPLPKKLVLKALEDVDKVLVVEELEPIVENQIKALVAEEGLDIEVHGKDYTGLTGEMTLERAARSILEFLGRGAVDIPWKPVDDGGLAGKLPPRPPAMCPGCPHRATYYALRRAVNAARVKPVYSGDIGCYSLGVLPPFREQDMLIEMGGSVGAGHGFAKVLDKQIVISIIGDSTFFHAGLPALANAVYNRSPQLVLVLDNRVTAMTGEQPNPGTGINAYGEPAPMLKVEDIARAMGVEKVVVFDPFKIKEATKALKEAIEYVRDKRAPAVAVARRACALEATRRARRAGIKQPLYQVIDDKCTACGVCYNAFTCPAIEVKENGKAWINPDLCTGCSVCAEVCPFNAIVKVVEEGEGWDDVWF